ncbi:hypothetical protein G6Z92_06440 [Vibrio aestuarianus subsp. cardii]|uniref:hypothetical protein n=1 Tax=Vibrio aestuarianus TaxID=28171 RepID=UPI0015C524F0|nr:hypothetical protein [Vibrio aestuarianus]NGZ66624.1 hypothetical protein [Vibrio aestuarianus subsp. cardii]
MREQDTFIASVASTLEDLLKTEHCRGMNIYCQFDSKEFCSSLKNQAHSRGVSKVVFSSGECFDIQNKRSLPPFFKLVQ